MEIEKIMDADGVNQLGDIQYLTPTSLKRKNSSMKMARLYNPKKIESADLIFFEKKFGEWVLSSENCFVRMDSDYLDLYMNGMTNGEDLTFEEFILKVQFWTKMFSNPNNH